MEEQLSPFSSLPVEIYDSILKFLPEEELLNVALISRTFHDAVFKSSVHMSKIAVRISVRKTEKLPPSFIMRSTRKYQNVKISGANIESYEDETYGWFNFLSCEILERFASSIVSLESDIDLVDFRVELPRLRRLKFTTQPHKATDLSQSGLIARLTHIRELSLHCPMSWESKSVLEGHFKGNSVLERLSIDEAMVLSEHKLPFFSEACDSVDFKIKLKSFSLFRGFMRSEDHWQHIVEFLKSQSSTLESLKIDACSLATFASLLCELPRLRTFEGNFTKIPGEDSVRLPRNFSIVSLKAPTVTGYEKALAEKLRGLRVLKLFHLTRVGLENIMSLRWPSLECIEFCHYLHGFTDNRNFKFARRQMLVKYPNFMRVSFVQKPAGERQNFF